MPREERMFGDVVDPSTGMGNRQRTAVLLTIVLESALLSAIVVVPLVALDVLPPPREAIGAFVAPPATPEPPPEPRPAAAPTARQPQVNPDAAPIEPPSALIPEQPRPIAFEPPPDTVAGGGDLANVLGGDRSGLAVAPPPSPPAPPAPVRVGGRISAPQKTRHVAPIFPAIAQSARVEGTVIIEATIDATGRVTNARVLRGHPLLDTAALDAVRQWEFMPTLLNNEPTPVIMTVTVNFRLS